MGKTVRVGALVHFAMPFRNAGSETVIHELMTAAHRAGHETTLWCTHADGHTPWRGTEPETVYEGVRVVRVRNQLVAAGQLKRWKPDVVVSHHQHATLSIRAAREIKARSVFLTHNDYVDYNRRPMRMKPDLVVFNTNHVQGTLTKHLGPPKASMTFHPPLTPERHLVSQTGGCVTLVNLNKDKGSDLFYDLAAAEPQRQFLGVVGGHGEQVIRNRPNVQIMEHTDHMTQVWAQTRVLLMPSRYESYGLVAPEAGLNGIPTIAHPTTGLKENLGAGGMFADRERIEEWQKLLGGLDDPRTYKEASEYARGRADDAITATRQSLETWCEWLDSGTTRS